VARSLHRPAIRSPTHPKVHRLRRSRTTPSFYGRYRSYNPWLPGFRVEQRESGLTASLAWGDDKPLARIGEAEFRVGEEDWSPERLRFDAVVDGRAPRANLPGETYYRSDFA
jgi:hypothetical protein